MTGLRVVDAHKKVVCHSDAAAAGLLCDGAADESVLRNFICNDKKYSLPK
jgi:hypothetical protein